MDYEEALRNGYGTQVHGVCLKDVLAHMSADGDPAHGDLNKE